MTSRLIVDQLEGKPGSGNIVTVPTGHTLYAPGCVIQVVHQTINDEKNNTSHGITNGVWQFTGVTATITPKFATSKILIQYDQSFFYQTAGGNGGPQGHSTRIYRGNTAITTRGGFAGFYLDPGNASNHRHHGYDHGTHLDSPNTTNPVTYNIYGYFWTSDWTGLIYQYGAITNGSNDSPSTITLMEIGA
jgi:hypothetical protein